RRINARSVVEDLAGQPLVDHVAEADVVIGENARANDKNGEQETEDPDSDTGRPETAGDSNAQACFLHHRLWQAASHCRPSALLLPPKGAQSHSSAVHSGICRWDT